MSAAPRVLIIAPRFFGYEREIAAAFQRQGWAPRFVDERPSNNAVMKAVIRIRPQLARQAVDRYYRRLLREGLSRGFQLVLVIKGEAVPRWFLSAVRKDSPRARMVFYSFDSPTNSGAFRALLDLFDDLFCFQEDAREVDPRFRLKHLFYVPAFHPRAGGAPRYEISFVGTLHSERYRFVTSLAAGFSSASLYFFVQARWYFALRRLIDRRYREVPWSAARFRRLDIEEVARCFRDSRAVLDMQHENQSGLTMRTFEVLASGAHLVTTNEAIAQSPLMETGRVVIVPSTPTPEERTRIVERIRALPALDGAPAGFEEYSVDAWVAEFIEAGDIDR